MALRPSLDEGLRRVTLERLFRVGVNLDRDAALPEPIGDGDEECDDDGEADSADAI